MDSTFLSIVIPAHNEERRLSNTLEQIFKFLSAQDFSAEVLVVENGSTDNTYAIAQTYTQTFKNLIVLKEKWPGKGNAVKQGMLEARGQYRFICDADLSMPVEEIPKFLPPILTGQDIAIASREVPGAVRHDEPHYRHFTGRIFNLLIRWLVLPGLQDTQCGYKCFRSDVAQDVFSYQTLNGWAFDVEILHIAKLRGYQIHEIPINWYFNRDTKISLFRDSLRMFLDLLAIRRNARRRLYDRKS